MWVLLLIPSCAAAVLTCLRLVRVAAIADSLTGHLPVPAEPTGIGLFETAYLAGGPGRVVELALVRMAGRGRLHLAHTGWTTVVDPQGRSRLERALISAIGPEGQCRTAALKSALAVDPTVHDIADRLALAGLATPAIVRDRALLAIRHVRYALLGTAALLVLSVLLSAPDGGTARAAVAWFALPLVLTGGTLLMARVDVHAYTAWATPTGQAVLRTVPHTCTTEDTEHDLLTAVAISGPDAVTDPRLRAALGD
ncbi:TIGR04222 domain-containing membrane protein [Kitasatospora sp. NPDC049285]|uniref:TIGR04222 domain-containing membrane protein n=1 Tax=Kitasatospora sp. NPDC049285 TaxID=3157096 RepID=UPI0034442274